MTNDALTKREPGTNGHGARTGGRKLAAAEKKTLMDTLAGDIQQVKTHVRTHFSELWRKARASILHARGADETMAQIKRLEQEIAERNTRLTSLRASIAEFETTPTLRDYLDYGVTPPVAEGNYIPNHDRTFLGNPIRTKLDLMIVEELQRNVNTDEPILILDELVEACRRELVMAETMAEARHVLDTFYNFDFGRFNIKIPRRLDRLTATDGAQLLVTGAVTATAALTAGGNGAQGEA